MTADALRRYLRARSQHPHAELANLGLGKKGAVTVSGVAQLLERRAKEAGVQDVHPHRFRHTFAHTWLVIPRLPTHFGQCSRRAGPSVSSCRPSCARGTMSVRVYKTSIATWYSTRPAA
jgi:integrase